jgi:hypothetical protein
VPIYVVRPNPRRRKAQQQSPSSEGSAIVDICARAWLRLGETIAEVLRWHGADVPPLSLDCRHSSQRVQFKLYDREELVKRMEAIGASPAAEDHE